MRFSATDYCDDQTWELIIGTGEPPALALVTSYGLRARMMRIFPRFIEGDKSITDPAAFTSPVLINHFFPNLIALAFTPLPGINVDIEYWVPGPHVIASRTRITNGSPRPRSAILEWAAVLNPSAGGQRMAPAEIGLTHMLSGQTGDIVPVFYLAGGARPGRGPFTSLLVNLELAPKESIYSTWVLGSSDSISSSYESARQITTRNWEAETARIVCLNTSLIDVHTGDSNWDLAFALAQTRALSLLFPSSENLPNTSFVSARLPDMGYSVRGDGSDYSHLWNGQTPLESYYLSKLLLPAYPEIARALLLNFLHTQTSEGFIDWKPGLSGQRSQMLATPLLSSLAWEIYKVIEDTEFLNQVYPALLAFLQHWFSVEHDRDSDGIPEWDHPHQTGIDEHPSFSTWQRWSPGIRITTVESPDLCALLFRECTTLIKIADLIGRQDTIPALQALSDHLKTAVEASWDNQKGCYHYWDRESHYCGQQQLLGLHQGTGVFVVNRTFAYPARIQVEIHSSDQASRPLNIYIHGSAPSGGHRVEKIDSEGVRWHMGTCRVTSERIYSALEHIEFQGLVETDQVVVHTVGHDLRDITTLLPLWAGIPTVERAKQLIRQTIANTKVFWGAYGLRTSADSPMDNAEAARYFKEVNIPYNCLIGEGLVRYGITAKAADLLTCIMKAVIKSLQQGGTFRQSYHSDTGIGNGERNALSGLPPLGLFLDVLGVSIINSEKVILTGTNPFPWPVTIKYQGLTILRQKHKTMVILPDGQNVTVKNGKTQIVGIE
jgi:hypothetical protein